jgi:hypothetical protein
MANGRQMGSEHGGGRWWTYNRHKCEEAKGLSGGAARVLENITEHLRSGGNTSILRARTAGAPNKRPQRGWALGQQVCSEEQRYERLLPWDTGWPRVGWTGIGCRRGKGAKLAKQKAANSCFDDNRGCPLRVVGALVPRGTRQWCAPRSRGQLEGRDVLWHAEQRSKNDPERGLRRMECGKLVQVKQTTVRKQALAMMNRKMGGAGAKGSSGTQADRLGKAMQEQKEKEVLAKRQKEIEEGRGQGVQHAERQKERADARAAEQERAAMGRRLEAMTVQEQDENTLQKIEASNAAYTEYKEGLPEEEQQVVEERMQNAAGAAAKQHNLSVPLARSVAQGMELQKNMAGEPRARISRVHVLLESEKSPEWRFMAPQGEEVTLIEVKNALLEACLGTSNQAVEREIQERAKWSVVTTSQKVTSSQVLWKPGTVLFFNPSYDAVAPELVTIAQKGYLQVNDSIMKVALKGRKETECEMKFQEQESTRNRVRNIVAMMHGLGWQETEMESYLLQVVKQACPMVTYVRMEIARTEFGSEGPKMSRINPYQLGDNFFVGGPLLFAGMRNAEEAAILNAAPKSIDVMVGVGDFILLTAPLEVGFKPLRLEAPTNKTEAGQAVMKKYAATLEEQNKALEAVRGVRMLQELGAGAKVAQHLEIVGAQMGSLPKRVREELRPAMEKLLHATGASENAALQELQAKIDHFTEQEIAKIRTDERQRQAVVHLKFIKGGADKVNVRVNRELPKKQLSNLESRRSMLESLTMMPIYRLEVIGDPRGKRVDLSKGVVVLATDSEKLWQESGGGKKAIPFGCDVEVMAVWMQETEVASAVSDIRERILELLQAGQVVFYPSVGFNDEPRLGPTTKVSEMPPIDGHEALNNPYDIRAAHTLLGQPKVVTENLPGVMGELRQAREAVVFEIDAGRMAYMYRPFYESLEMCDGSGWQQSIVYGAAARDTIIGILRGAGQRLLWQAAACGLWESGTRFTVREGAGEEEVAAAAEPRRLEGPNTVDTVLKGSPLMQVPEAQQHRDAILDALLTSEAGGETKLKAYVVVAGDNQLILPIGSGMQLQCEASTLVPGQSIPWDQVQLDPAALEEVKRRLTHTLARDGVIMMQDRGLGGAQGAPLEEVQAEWSVQRKQQRGTVAAALPDHAMGFGGRGAGQMLMELVQDGFAVQEQGHGSEKKGWVVVGALQEIISGIPLFSFEQVYGNQRVPAHLRKHVKIAKFDDFGKHGQRLSEFFEKERDNHYSAVLLQSAEKLKAAPVFLAEVSWEDEAMFVDDEISQMEVSKAQPLLQFVPHPAVVTQKGLEEFWKSEDMEFRAVPDGVVILGIDDELTEWADDDVRWLEFDPKAQAPFTLLRDRAAQAAAGEDVGETKMEE